MPTVRLTWEDLNSGFRQEDEIRIYRKTAAFDAGSLPSVFATLPADTLTWDDTTPLNDTNYYYAVAAVKDGDLQLAFTGTVAIGSPPPPPDSIEWFLGRNSALQALTPSTLIEVAFGTEVLDSYGVFGASRFAVDPAIDGFYAILVVSVVLNPSRAQVSYLGIEVSADGGTSWSPVAGRSVNAETRAGVAAHVLLSFGQVYRVVYTNGTLSQDASLSATTQFGGIILEPVT